MCLGLLPVAGSSCLFLQSHGESQQRTERFSNHLVVFCELALFFRPVSLLFREKLEELEMLRTLPKPPATGLLHLPIEIRLQIYYYCIPRKRIIEATNPRFNQFSFVDPIPDLGSYNPNKNKNSIFLLSKQISEEALDVLYGDNVFKFSLDGEVEYHFQKNFTDRNRQRMRFLLLIAWPWGFSYTPEKTVDDALWCSILPHLKGLRLVVGQPVEAWGYDNASRLEQDMDRWINWIRPFFQCFGQHLSIQTNVEIDNDGRVETGALMKECLPHGYQEIRCRDFGDFIFKRGQFSWESGYWDNHGPLTGDWNY
jgi:hypothetical protein